MNVQSSKEILSALVGFDTVSRTSNLDCIAWIESYLDKHGVKQPKTWADLVAAAKALTLDTNGDGRTDIYGITIPGDNLFINILLGELIKANGGQLFDKDNRPTLTDRRSSKRLSSGASLRGTLLRDGRATGISRLFRTSTAKSRP